jgi:hypothetical protein
MGKQTREERMSDSTNPKQKWQIVVAVLSMLYAVVYGFMRLRLDEYPVRFTHLWDEVIVAAMALGAFGLLIRKSWVIRILRLAAWLVIAKVGYTLVDTIRNGPNSILAACLEFIYLLPVIAWPVFLRYWLDKHKL